MTNQKGLESVLALKGDNGKTVNRVGTADGMRREQAEAGQKNNLIWAYKFSQEPWKEHIHLVGVVELQGRFKKFSSPA